MLCHQSLWNELINVLFADAISALLCRFSRTNQQVMEENKGGAFLMELVAMILEYLEYGMGGQLEERQA